jgi:hypothetical protein
LEDKGEGVVRVRSVAGAVVRRYMYRMDKFTSAERVKRRRDKMRAAGLRPVQIWVPDTRVASFASECRRQCESIAKADRTEAGRAETEFWERVSADAWDDLG